MDLHLTEFQMTDALVRPKERARRVVTNLALTTALF
jgi:hypothetical protein